MLLILIWTTWTLPKSRTKMGSMEIRATAMFGRQRWTIRINFILEPWTKTFIPATWPTVFCQLCGHRYYNGGMPLSTRFCGSGRERPFLPAREPKYMCTTRGNFSWSGKLPGSMWGFAKWSTIVEISMPEARMVPMALMMDGPMILNFTKKALEPRYVCAILRLYYKTCSSNERLITLLTLACSDLYQCRWFCLFGTGRRRIFGQLRQVREKHVRVQL